MEIKLKNYRNSEHPSKSLGDVVILRINNKIGKLRSYDVNGNWTIGQDCYFLGFPYKEKFNSNVGVLSIPFIKKAIVSAYFQTKHLHYLLLDGHNNPGFSVGPVVAYDYKNRKNIIIAVISAYYPQKNKTIIDDDANKIPLEYTENSGINITTPAKYLNEILDKIN